VVVDVLLVEATAADLPEVPAQLGRVCKGVIAR
jgi:hypothetical protein